MDAEYNGQNEQICDQTPIELPLGYQHPEDIQTMIARMVTNAEILRKQEEEGVDTEEEADDFDVMEEEIVVPSNHEYTEMQEERVKYERKKKADVQPESSPPKGTAESGSDPEEKPESRVDRQRPAVAQ